jgi:hypothetical protein
MKVGKVGAVVYREKGNSPASKLIKSEHAVFSFTALNSGQPLAVTIGGKQALA